MSNLKTNKNEFFHIELVADLNRSDIKIFCPQIQSNEHFKELDFILQRNKINFHQPQRVVYSEISSNLEKVIYRLKELNQFTQAQRLKLIRKQNPNWRSIRFLND